VVGKPSTVVGSCSLRTPMQKRLFRYPSWSIPRDATLRGTSGCIPCTLRSSLRKLQGFHAHNRCLQCDGTTRYWILRTVNSAVEQGRRCDLRLFTRVQPCRTLTNTQPRPTINADFNKNDARACCQRAYEQDLSRCDPLFLRNLAGRRVEPTKRC